MLVGEGEPELDYLQNVDVHPQGFVVVIGVRFEGSDWSDDDSGELCVHGDVREIVDDFTDQIHLLLQVIVPDFANLNRVIFQEQRHLYV